MTYFVRKVLEFLQACPLNPLNAELNPIHHLLALVGAHHIPHVSRVRVHLLSTAFLKEGNGALLAVVFAKS